VGKTTISAGLAFRSRQVSSEAVEICSVDPAPSLDDVFGTAIEDRPKSVLGDKGLRASEFDSVAHFKRWVSETRAQVEQATAAEVSGVHIDLSLERRLFSELLELVPPGVDEVLSVFRLVDLSAGPAGKVIIDMAPTGHALELLRTPDRMLVWSRLLLKSLATHRKLTLVREAAARIAELEVRARELAGSLRNSMSARVFVVMLPELLPDRETRRLLAQLDGLGVSIEAVFVNRVLLPGKTAPCARCGIKAEWQVRTLQSLKRQLGGRRVYLIRDFPHEIAGRDGLKRLTRELWQLN
jgi:arsenite-transporting ATPase